jgi:hypothetical protein
MRLMGSTALSCDKRGLPGDRGVMPHGRDTVCRQGTEAYPPPKRATQISMRAKQTAPSGSQPDLGTRKRGPHVPDDLFGPLASRCKLSNPYRLHPPSQRSSAVIKRVRPATLARSPMLN